MKRFSTTDVKRLQLRAQLMQQTREKLAITPGTPMAAVKSARASAQVLDTLKALDALAVRAP
jgi:hypothetical protein